MNAQLFSDASNAPGNQPRVQEIWFPINTGKVNELQSQHNRLPPIFKREITHMSAEAIQSGVDQRG
jgi:hypothetical protein